MNRTELEQYILETYQADSDFPWKKYPAYQVFRHRRSRKWFALVMEVPENKLGREETACLEVVNVKCEPAMIGALRRKAGFYPAYHMNKDTWITMALDGSVTEDMIKKLVDMSFDLTDDAVKKRKRRTDV